MKINVIIPNYNGSDLVLRNLPSVIKSLDSYEDSFVTIVDDGSVESDYEKISNFVSSLKNENKTSIKLIRKNKNSGFSSTVNTASLGSSAKYLVFLNTDVSPEKDFLQPIIKDFENNEKLFGVGCLDKSEEKDGVVLRGRGLASWKRGFLIHKRGEVDFSDTFWISGGSSVVRGDLFREIGGFDEIYDPFYWEDIDLSYRARKFGYELMFEKESKVTHRHQEGSIKKHYSKSKIIKIAYRNQFIFVWKNITDKELMISHLSWLPYHLVRSFMRRDFDFIHGFLLALLMLPDIIRRRNLQKKRFVKKDTEILSN